MLQLLQSIAPCHSTGPDDLHQICQLLQRFALLVFRQLLVELFVQIPQIFPILQNTGGTVSGVGEYLKSKKPEVRIVAVEPASSPLLSGGVAGPHGIQGIGANFIPEVLNTGIYDAVVAVTEEQAYSAARLAGRREGILVGISSGAALHAAIEQARLPENEGKTVVALLPDTGERYLSTALFE